jgi:hypothetical protein
MGHLLGVEVESDEVAHGQDFVAAGALAAEPQLATPQIAVAASSFPQKAVLAGGTFVDRLGDCSPATSSGMVSWSWPTTSASCTD